MGTTVVGVSGTMVTIPFTSADNYVMNQVLAAINGVYGEVFAGTTSVSAYTALVTAVTTPGAVIAEGRGTDTVATQLALRGSDTFLAAVNLGAGTNVVSAISGVNNAAMTVVSSANTDLVFQNYGASTTAYLGGGANNFRQMTSTANADIYVAGSGVSSVIGGAVINAARGESTTITLGANSFTNVAIGNNTSISAASPTAGTATDWISLGKSTIASVATVTATLTGAENVTLGILNTGNTFIDAGASDVLILPGSTGNTTLFGGTGTDTVLYGTGYFQGGSAGGNLLMSSTVEGSTTLIGGAGGSGDSLYSYAGDNYLLGGVGSDLIWDMASAGDTLISSGGVDTIFGSSAGGNTIGFGSATTNAYGDIGNATSAANTYFQNQAAGTDYIFDFKSGSDKFNLNLGIGTTNLTLSIDSLAVSGSDTDVTLSDGTKVVFVNNTSVSTNDFIAHA